MKKIIKITFTAFLLLGMVASCSGQKTYNESTKKKPVTTQKSSTSAKKKNQVKKKATSVKKKNSVAKKESKTEKNNLLPTESYKKDVIATYYHDKFNGRKTASGAIFDNSKQTAAHRTLPFGTKLKVINRVNGKWIYVTVNDRGPVKKTREIDLTKRAFMDITDNKNKGELLVDIEIIK